MRNYYYFYLFLNCAHKCYPNFNWCDHHRFAQNQNSSCKRNEIELASKLYVPHNYYLFKHRIITELPNPR